MNGYEDDGYNVHCNNTKKSKKIRYKSTTSFSKTNKNNHPHKEQLTHSTSEYQYEGKKNIHHTNKSQSKSKSKSRSKSLACKPPLLPTTCYHHQQTRSTSTSISKEDEKTQTNNTSTSTNKAFNPQKACKKYHILSLLATGNIPNKEEIMINFISGTNTAQRQQIKTYLQTQFDFDIIEYINQNFKGMLKRILLYSMQTQMQRNVYLLEIGVKKMKDIRCILDVLCTYNGSTIKTMMSLYQKSMFEKSLEQQIIKLTKGDTMVRSFLFGILNGSRATKNEYNNKRNLAELIEKDRLFLVKMSMKSSWGTANQARFIDIFTRRSFEYLNKLCISFEKEAGTSLIDALKGILEKTDISYAVGCILSFINDKNEYYRSLIQEGMKTGGHKHILFWKVIIDRMDYDLQDMLDGYARFERYKGDIPRDPYEIFYHITTVLAKEDEDAANLLHKITKLPYDLPKKSEKKRK